METDVLLCSRCDAEDADERDGLCRDCHQAEHGPDDFPLAGGDVAGYRTNMIDAGRAHLL